MRQSGKLVREAGRLERVCDAQTESRLPGGQRWASTSPAAGQRGEDEADDSPVTGQAGRWGAAGGLGDGGRPPVTISEQDGELTWETRAVGDGVGGCVGRGDPVPGASV